MNKNLIKNIQSLLQKKFGVLIKVVKVAYKTDEPYFYKYEVGTSTVLGPNFSTYNEALYEGIYDFYSTKLLRK